MDAVAAAGVVGRANNTPAALPAGSDVANLSLLGYNPLEHFTGRAALGGRRPGHRAGPRRLGRPLQSGDHRRPGDAGLHGRPHLDRGGRRPACRLSRRSWAATAWSSIPGVSYRNLLVLRGDKAAGPLLPRHPHHAAPRPDRSIRAGRLSPRAGQRPFEPIDERQRGALGRPSGQRCPPQQRQAAGDERLALGTGRRPAAGAVLPSFTASRAR